ncbi:MAG: DNA-processing protein DprA [Arcanobacterium sp.]|nr:DNA-processing protein DprA [Arcanobacterium sp.]
MHITDEHRSAITWSRIVEGGDVVAKALVTHYGFTEALEKVRRAPEQYPQGWLNRLAGLSAFDDRVLEKLRIRILIPSDDAWPEQLADLGEREPLMLWVRGEASVLRQRSCAIVGSRACTQYGSRIASQLAFDLAGDYPIISGGAFGIDAAAHQGAITAGGSTVIVTAGGVERPYPQAHAQLYQAVLSNGGAVMSESPVGAVPARFRFLSRNRIIAALSQATVVVEAPIRSGALSTARAAMAIGREVGAVPGNVTMPASDGCHELIRNGGQLVAGPKHVRELLAPIGEQLELGVDTSENSTSGDFLNVIDASFDPVRERVFDAVPKIQGRDAASIARVAGVSLMQVRVELARLAADERVENNSGLWRKRKLGAAQSMVQQ